ncbi:hypothetical protein FOZ76_03020 [Verticiella sediminum]|uniref:Uncharacterized protein n=1 Tax=Verticiella sediminum TaxID=1247510 RepID=A0A556AZI7_9BURK|nr:hypothetical protein [Verticiella sediminum]TSH98338.1 hypothetical protein FOZ76_03020 [Verticiella sediminum]
MATVSRDFIDLGAEGVSQSRSAMFNRQTIQAAVNELHGRSQGGCLLLPACSGGGTIDVDQYSYLYNDITIEGYGQATVLRNVTETETFGGQGRIWDVGNYNPNDILTEPAYDVDPLARGSVTATLVTAGHASQFAPGDLVWVATSERVGMFAVGFQANRIRSISGAVLTMERPWYDDIGGVQPQIYKSSGTIINANDGRPRRLVAGCAFRKLRIPKAAHCHLSATGMGYGSGRHVRMHVRGSVDGCSRGDLSQRDVLQQVQPHHFHVLRPFYRVGCVLP